MRKYSLILLVVAIVSAYAFQANVILPFVTKVTGTELFTGKSEQGGQNTAINDDRTAMAFIQCNNRLRESLDGSDSVDFSQQDYTAWNIGFGRYVVKSYFDETDPSGILLRKNYACEIVYVGGDELKADNWTLLGIDYS